MKQRIVLLGGGHAHAGVLRAQALTQAINADITAVSVSALAPYSGMLPGWMAGHYTWQEICLNFATLSAKAGAKFVEGAAQSLDLARKQLHLASGQVLDFDVLSLNIGSTHRPPINAATGDDSAVLALRPLGDLVARTQAFVAAYKQSAGPLTVVVVGAGGAGFEMALAMRHSLKRAYPGRALSVQIVTDGAAPLPTHSPAVQRAAARALKQHGIELITNTAVQEIDGHLLTLAPAGGADQAATTQQVEKIIWAGGAQPHLWPQQSGLQLDARGFIAVNAALQSTSHPFVFASGDCAGFEPPLPKAGVYPVKQGPLLARNLAAAMHGATLENYTPQPRALGIFATGEKHAIASYGPLALSGDWVWRWKDRIDRGFLQKHS